MLEIKNLTVTLSDRELLKNISLKIDDGARVLLSGHNGSGKSTLANTIAGNPSYTVKSGTIKFNGSDITNENIDSIIKGEVGKVFVKVLEHAGVYKCDEDGRKAFRRFTDSVK